MRMLHVQIAGLAVAIVATHASAQIRLTNVFQFSTSATGDVSGGQLWDTVQGGSFAIWVSADGERLNGKLGETSIQTVDFLMSEGVYNFQIWGQVGSAGAIPFAGMNLFFDDAVEAGISVFAESQNAPGPAPAFMANSSASTFGPFGGSGAASGSLSFESGGLTATLTSYFYAAPQIFGLDEGSGFNRVPAGGDDFYGEFTIQVVPAPASAALLGGAGLLAARRRRS